MAKRKGNSFDETAMKNNKTYQQYYSRLMGLAISTFEWKNLPEGIDPRFLELTLFSDGMAVFFKDEELDQFLCLQCMVNGNLDVYRIPNKRRAYATNGYFRELNEENSVIIFNNELHTNSLLEVEMYSERLYNIERTIDVNVNAQKTPILIQCNEKQRLTLQNLYMQYEGNFPFIFGDASLDLSTMKVLTTGAPYIADNLQELKTQIWSEALTTLGISNVSVQKKERLVSDEVSKNMGAILTQQNVRLKPRKQAVEKINKMFDLNIEVDYVETFIDVENKDEELPQGGEGNEQIYD